MRRIPRRRRSFFSRFSLSAQNRLELTVDTIMRGPGLSGYAPKSVRWSPDGQWVFFEWKQYTDPTEENFDTYVVGRDGKGLRKLTDEEAKHAPPVNGDWTRDRKRAVYVSRGDVFLYDVAAKQRRALTDTTEAESERALHARRTARRVRARQQPLRGLAEGRLGRAEDEHRRREREGSARLALRRPRTRTSPRARSGWPRRRRS